MILECGNALEVVGAIIWGGTGRLEVPLLSQTLRINAVNVTRNGSDLCLPQLDLPPGVYTLTGPNGAGKTTLLRALASNSKITLAASSPTRVLFTQQYTDLIYPYKKVWWNVALPSIIDNRVSVEGAKKICRDWLTNCGLDPSFADRYPATLSGGEKQLILVGRITACAHTVVLLDEPVAALDAQRRRLFWRTVLDTRYHFTDGPPERWAVIVTHILPEEARLESVWTFPGLSGKQLHIHRVLSA